MDEVQEDEEELWHFIEEAMKAALEQFVNTRILEGENLKKDLLGKLDHMEELVAFVEKRSPEIMKEYRSKLESKVKELLGDTTIDESRIATEVIIYADKICVDEETVRLRSHIEHARKCLNEDGGIGTLAWTTHELAIYSYNAFHLLTNLFYPITKDQLKILGLYYTEESIKSIMTRDDFRYLFP